MRYDIVIKKLREATLVSQEELARILGVSIVTVNRWENAKFEPTIKLKRKIVELCKQNNIKLEDK